MMTLVSNSRRACLAGGKDVEPSIAVGTDKERNVCTILAHPYSMREAKAGVAVKEESSNSINS